MKLSKFMCAAFAAAMVLAGCNKENETPVDDGSNGFKSVTLKLENVAAALTKLPSEDYIGNSDNVYLSSFQVFFSDGTNLFEAYNVDQSAPAETFFKLPDDLTTIKQFHYLPHAVNEVLVIGNFQDKINLGTVGEGKKYSLSRQELRTQINQLKIEEQQDPDLVRDNEYLIDNALIPLPMAVCGGKVEVPTVDGKKCEVKIEPGTTHGKLLRVKGKGLPRLNSYGCGDLLVYVSVFIPKNLSKDEKKEMEKLMDSDGFKPKASDYEESKKMMVKMFRG